MTEPDVEKDLRAIVGDRVTFSRFERWPYTSDILPLPRGIKSFFTSTPDAIIKPNTVDQVSQVVDYCHRKGIPVTTRGGGSSGLLAAVPKRRGVVLDMLDLNAVLEIHPTQETATAQAGLTWWELEKRLNRQGLTLKSYPSSARSATLAGWAMTGGLGIGSLKYGPVSDHISSLEIVHADGTVKEYRKETGIEGFFETEGLLGVVTRLTVSVRRIPAYARHHLITFQDMARLFEAVRLLAGHKPVPYTMEFLDDGYLALLKTAGYAREEEPPGSGTLLVSVDGAKSDVDEGERFLSSVTEDLSGMEKDGAEELWRERFDLLRVRRAVPSLLLSSVYLPIGELATFFRRQRTVARRIAGTVGYVVSPGTCNVMPMIATDARRPIEYTFSLHTPRSVSNVAVSLGGRPGGGIGLWNGPYRRQILGELGIARARELKRTLDPKGTLNPGMWLDPPPVLTPVLYQPAMLTASLVDRLLPARQRSMDLSGFERELAACVQCGYCTTDCPTRLNWLSTTPRGRILATRELFLKNPQEHGEIAPEYVNRLFQCTMCGRCGVDCSTDIKARAMWLGVRQYLSGKGLVPESLTKLSQLIDENHNIAARPNDRRANWLSRIKLPYDLKRKRSAPVVYFVGCVASFFPMTQPSARAFAQVMDKAGVDFAIAGGEEWCCGFPLVVTGDKKMSRKLLRHNIERMKEMGAQTIVTACPGCYKVWKDEYREVIEERHPFAVVHATEFMARLIEQKRLDVKPLERKVTYHDPCDIGRNAHIFDEPRFIMGKIPGLELVEMENNREYCTCCGSGGNLLVSNEDMSRAIAARKMREIMATGARTAVTACPSCIRAISMAKTTEKVELDVLDITEVLWKAVDG